MRQLTGADAGRRPRGLHGLGRVEGIAALRRLPHRDEPLARRHEIDLLVEDPVLLPHADRDEQDAEDVVVVPLEPWARLVVVPRRLAQEVERPVVDVGRQRLLELLLARIEQVDPLGHAAGVRRGFGYTSAVSGRGAVSAASG